MPSPVQALPDPSSPTVQLMRCLHFTPSAESAVLQLREASDVSEEVYLHAATEAQS
jgi:hypothetical protein